MTNFRNAGPFSASAASQTHLTGLYHRCLPRLDFRQGIACACDVRRCWRKQKQFGKRCRYNWGGRITVFQIVSEIKESRIKASRKRSGWFYSVRRICHLPVPSCSAAETTGTMLFFRIIGRCSRASPFRSRVLYPAVGVLRTQKLKSHSAESPELSKVFSFKAWRRPEWYSPARFE